VPVQQHTTACSARPSVTSRAAASLAHAQSSRSASLSAPCGSGSWPRRRSSETTASAAPGRSSAATEIRIEDRMLRPRSSHVAQQLHAFLDLGELARARLDLSLDDRRRRIEGRAQLVGARVTWVERVLLEGVVVEVEELLDSAASHELG